MISLSLAVLPLLVCDPVAGGAGIVLAAPIEACAQSSVVLALTGGNGTVAGNDTAPSKDAAPSNGTALEEAPASGPLPSAPLVITDDGDVQAAAPAAPQSGPDKPNPVADPADIIVWARHAAPPGDPLESVNMKAFELTQEVDQAVVRPVALAFAKTVPGPVRDGLGNALTNLREPVVFLNYMLQHRIGKAVETLSRFVINSTLGVAGLFDIAKRRPFKLPRRPNGLADTLGFYGVHAGPFLFLPLVGPITLRDLAGGLVDRLVVPTFFGKPFNRLYFTVPTGLFAELDHRAAFDDQLKTLHKDPATAYAATRAFYLQRREAEIEALHSRHRKPKSAASVPGGAAAPAPDVPQPKPDATSPKPDGPLATPR
ncbi:MAG: VacJ family lipoprotein [Sphingomonas sp.]